MAHFSKNRPKRPYRYGSIDIAKAVGKTLHAVSDDRYRRFYDPHDLSSVAAYIHRCHLKANKPRKSGKRKALPSEPPKESDSTT